MIDVNRLTKFAGPQEKINKKTTAFNSHYKLAANYTLGPILEDAIRYICTQFRKEFPYYHEPFKTNISLFDFLDLRRRKPTAKSLVIELYGSANPRINIEVTVKTRRRSNNTIEAAVNTNHILQGVPYIPVEVILEIGDECQKKIDELRYDREYDANLSRIFDQQFKDMGFDLHSVLRHEFSHPVLSLLGYVKKSPYIKPSTDYHGYTAQPEEYVNFLGNLKDSLAKFLVQGKEEQIGDFKSILFAQYAGTIKKNDDEKMKKFIKDIFVILTRVEANIQEEDKNKKYFSRVALVKSFLRDIFGHKYDYLLNNTKKSP